MPFIPDPPDKKGHFVPDSPSLMKRGWDALKKPAEMSQQGLEMLSEELKPTPEFTGNLPRDVIKNYPSFSASVLSKVAPGFINRASLVGMGLTSGLQGIAAIPKVQEAASEIGGQLESAAGSPKGTLKQGFESVKNFFGPGRKAASPVYESARPFTEHPELKNILDNKEYIDKARQLAEEGKLAPFEAFKARQGTDSLVGKKSIVQDAVHQLRDVFDPIAKSDSRIAQGDEMFQKGLRNEALRGLLPKNKYGTTSAFKTGIMAAVPGMGWALSPIVQGAGATGLGALVRMNPAIGGVISRLLAEMRQRETQQSQLGTK
jgi:hypothetical protein